MSDGKDVGLGAAVDVLSGLPGTRWWRRAAAPAVSVGLRERRGAGLPEGWMGWDAGEPPPEDRPTLGALGGGAGLCSLKS